MDSHSLEPTTIIIGKKRPQSAGPKRPQFIKPTENSDEIKVIETTKLDVASRIAQARVALGYKTRKDLANKLSISVDVVTCIESRKGQVDKQKLNKICQFLRIKTT